MYLDWTYIVLVLPAVLFAMWASAKVNRTFEKYKNSCNSRRITGAQAARWVLDRNGLNNVRIEHISGSLTDHYDPSTNVVRLSDDVYGSTSTVAVGVACHEVGHAIQHATNYAPVKIRTAIVPITNIGAKISVPLIIIGLLLASFGDIFVILAYVGVACFGLSTVFQLVTLPTEFNASRRALNTIEETNLLTGREFDEAKQVLTAAAMTYVAALAVSFMQLLRFLIIVGSRNRD
ncbi:MAG: zinc metallopeptidase [Firmicutes bacterium]|nr:zinc metallopeptidase [Bacillota bacterium]